jgi:hypothetical protein
MAFNHVFCNFCNNQIDLSFVDPRAVLSYLETSRTGFIPPPSMLQSPLKDFRVSAEQLIPHLFGSQPQIPVVPYKTTVTPFGPILPTLFTLSPPDSSGQPPRAISSYVMQPQKQDSRGDMTLTSQPERNLQRLEAEKLLHRLMAQDSSSSEGDSDRPRSSPLESHTTTRRPSREVVFKQQETAVHSPVLSTSIPPVPRDAPFLSPPIRGMDSRKTPRSTDRMRKKKEELEKVQQFLEESRAVHEKIYASFDVRKVSTRGTGPSPAVASSNRRASLSDYVSDANNVAELRRNIAVNNKREVSPLPPRAPSAQRTPSASSKSPRPASPDRIVSGVFVSYPRKPKRSISAPPVENQPPPAESTVEGNLLSSLRPQGSGKAKMTAEQYAELRRNLLSHSEQHAVTSTGSSLS